MKKLILTMLALVSCTNEDNARSTLLASGFTKITITGYRFGCGDDQCTGFEAKGPTGRWTTGVVGCGLATKGCTVRIDTP